MPRHTIKSWFEEGLNALPKKRQKIVRDRIQRSAERERMDVSYLVSYP